MMQVLLKKKKKDTILVPVDGGSVARKGHRSFMLLLKVLVPLEKGAVLFLVPLWGYCSMKKDTVLLY